jgi:hypothetical protein
MWIVAILTMIPPWAISGVEGVEVGFGVGDVFGGVEIGEPEGLGSYKAWGDPEDDIGINADGMDADELVQWLVKLQRQDFGRRFEDGQELELAQGDGGDYGWCDLFVEETDCGLRAAVDGKHGDAGGLIGCGDGGDPAFEECGGQERHVDRKNQDPVVGRVREGSFDAADGAAAGMDVWDERGVGSERGIGAEDVNLGADAAELGDGMLDKGLAGEGKEGFVRAHAGAAAAGEDVAGDGRGGGHD